MKKISTILFAFTLVAGGLFAQAPKKVLLEDYTGAWCGYCPRGLTVSNQMEAAHPTNVIALGMHEGASASSDAMATTYTNSLCNYLTTGYPTGGIDRVLFTGQTSVGVSTNTWSIHCSQQLAVSAPLNVFISSTYNSSTRMVNVTVNANFVTGTTGDLRVNCLLVEDSVTGVGAGYDQHNYMGSACSSPDPSSPWYTFPCTIAGYNHRHVVRAQLANNAWGESGIIPNPAIAGQTYSKSYSYTLPLTWDDSQIEIVAFVSHFGATNADRSVLNANKIGLGGSVLGINDPVSGGALISGLDQNYPNPFSEFTNINFKLAGTDHVTLKIYDLLGKEVTTLVNEKLTSGEFNLVWDGTNKDGNPVVGGLYFYRLATSTQVFTKQMTLIRN